MYDHVSLPFRCTCRLGRARLARSVDSHACPVVCASARISSGCAPQACLPSHRVLPAARRLARASVLAVCGGLALSCGGTSASPTDGGHGGRDAGTDARADVRTQTDSSSRGRADGHVDVRVDAGHPDAAVDAGRVDATTEAGPRDAGRDAPADVHDGAADAPSRPDGSRDAAVPDADASWPGPPPSSLPVTYTRPDKGAPLTPAEVDAATDQLIQLLQGTDYFDVIDSRIHGWPEDGPAGWFWGEWWSGITVTKSGGVVTYTHPPDGSDNDGMRTAPMLEGSCYARLLWGQPLYEDLIRRITRGFSADALAMVRSTTDTAGTMLARTHYGPNYTSTDHGRTIVVDMSADTPGQNGTSQYVNVPTNPTFGDIWIKNYRSKDDMGHVFRAIFQSQACAPYVSADAQTDMAQTVSLYASYSQQVQAAGWGIATLDTSAQVILPPKTTTMSWYFLEGNLECPGALMMALLGSGSPGSLSCGDGISLLEIVGSSYVDNSNEQILRSSHEAAANASFYVPGQESAGLQLLRGLASRVDTAIAEVDAGDSGVNPADVAALVLHAANAGVPLTSQEIRYVYAQLGQAVQSYLTAANELDYALFDTSTPDGTYAYEPTGSGFAFGDIGLMLGQCAAPYRNPATRTMFDCARLVAAFQTDTAMRGRRHERH